MTIRIGARDLRIVSPITKVEPQADGSLLVEGVATSEAVDLAGEVVDFGTAKEAFAAWRGNIREQHDPTKAVGHALEVIPDDDAKHVVVRAFVSAGAPDTQKKVLDGTLGFYSIGGRTKAVELDKALKASDGKPARRLFMERISEVSLVDSGANPDSGIAIVKQDGEQLVAVGLAEEVEKATSGIKFVIGFKKGGGSEVQSVIFDKNKFTVPEAKSWLKDHDMKAGDPDVTGDSLRFRQKDPGQYTRFRTMSPGAKEKADMASETTKWDGGELLDCRQALEALQIVGSLIFVESSEQHNEPPEQMAQLKSAFNALKDYIASEITEDEGDELAAADKIVDVKKDETGATPEPEGAATSEDVTPPAPAEPPPVTRTMILKAEDIPVDRDFKPGDPAVTQLAKMIAAAMADADGDVTVVTTASSKQEDTPPKDEKEKPEEPPQEPTGEPPAPPAPNKTVDVASGLVEKVETMTGENAALKADLVTKGEEIATLRKQVDELQATVEKFGKRVVEPGTPVFKGPDGKPTTQPQGTVTDGAISVEKITELVKAANGDAAVLQRSLGMELAQAQVRKAISGR